MKKKGKKEKQQVAPEGRVLQRRGRPPTEESSTSVVRKDDEEYDVLQRVKEGSGAF